MMARELIATETIALSPGDALLVVDVQNDFLPGGALAVPCGDRVIPVINAYLHRFRLRGYPVFATRDWHPADHCSFLAEGGPWPPHCIANTGGAGFPTDLALPADLQPISKATARAPDSYSGFAGTDLADRLREAGVKRLFVAGLATDYCVLHTVCDALAEGFAVVLLVDAVRAVNARAHDGDAAIAEMTSRGAVSATSEQVPN